MLEGVLLLGCLGMLIYLALKAIKSDQEYKDK